MARFKATKDQLADLLAKAANASAPVGMGFLHYDGRKTFTAKDFPNPQHGADYVQGRMVKFYPYEVSPGLWELDEPAHGYQSWAGKYPTAKALIEAAGLKVEDEVQPTQSKEI